MTRYLLALLLLLPMLALADPVTVRVMFPSTACNGDPLGDVQMVEVYSDVNPIPYDDAEDCSDGVVAPPPAGFTPITSAAPIGSTSVDVPMDLVVGDTYFFRARIQGQFGGWSALSIETQHTIAPPLPNRATVIIIGS